MKIAISGINGFIGTHLKNKLIGLGNDVIGIDRDLLYNPNDLSIFLNYEKPDIIYHLAAYGNHYNQTDNFKCINANIIALYNLLEWMTTHKLTMFYNFTSSSVDLDIKTFYSATKASGELLCKAYKNKYNLPILTIKPYSIFGPAEAIFRFIPTIIYSLLHNTDAILDKYPVHDWIYIDDFIDCLLRGYSEIGTGIGTSNIQVVRILEKISGKKLNYIKSQQRLRSYDSIDWICKRNPPIKCSYNLEEGLRKTFEYYEKQGFKK